MARSARRFVMLGSALGSAAVVHALTLERSELHDVKSASQHYATMLAMKFAGKCSELMMRRDLDTADYQQRELLKALLAKNKDTECGKDRGYASFLADPDPIAAFRARHPLTRYQDYAYYVDRIGEGHKKVLTADDVQFLGVTSGTSGKRHLLPMTSSIQGHFFLRGITSLFHTMFTTWPSTSSLQKSLKLTYMPTSHYTAAGVRLGPASSNPSDPAFRRQIFLCTTPWEAFQAALPEQEGLYLHLLFGLCDRNLGTIEGNFASLPYLAAEKLENDWRALADDIERGTVSKDAVPSLSPQARQELEAKMVPNPKRAQEIRRECSSGTHGVMLRLWPKLRLIVACSTGSFIPYARALVENHAAGVPIFSPVYAATEGLLGLCLDPPPLGDGTATEYTLVPSSMFFEFIPLDHADESQPETLLPSELSVPNKYELVVTTRAGLCRWRIGDVVQCVGYNGQSPVVRFSHRQGQVLNIHGEKLGEDALAAAIQDTLGSNDQVAKACLPSFVAAERFEGARDGYYFGTGPDGLGYYADEYARQAGRKSITHYTACESILLLESSGTNALEESQAAPSLSTWSRWLSPTSKSGGSRAGHYVVFVEMASQGNGDSKGCRAAALQSQQLDRVLQERSQVYQSFRVKGAIGQLEIIAVQPGSFATLRERWLLQRGATPNQQKVPRVLRDTATAQFLLSQRVQ